MLKLDKKTIKSYIDKFFTYDDEMREIPREDRIHAMWEDDLVRYARHFYGLALSDLKKMLAGYKVNLRNADEEADETNSIEINELINFLLKQNG